MNLAVGAKNGRSGNRSPKFILVVSQGQLFTSDNKAFPKQFKLPEVALLYIKCETWPIDKFRKIWFAGVTNMISNCIVADFVIVCACLYCFSLLPSPSDLLKLCPGCFGKNMSFLLKAFCGSNNAKVKYESLRESTLPCLRNTEYIAGRA